MWNDSRSLVLSKVCVIIFMAFLLACAVLAPRLVMWLMSMSYFARTAGQVLFLSTIYIGCIPAAALLIFLYLLLQRISADEVFVSRNVAYLRYISWCCFIGALICAVSAYYYLPWLAIGIAAAFMGLIVRIVKNVIAKAVSLQDDADYTI